MANALTSDIGLAVRDCIENTTFHLFNDGEETGETERIRFVDCSDPDNLKLELSNGQTFTVRIIAG